MSIKIGTAMGSTLAELEICRGWMFLKLGRWEYFKDWRGGALEG
ncbi:hypothetical protein [Ectothiorhodospira shaposhnikovii]|nr:hypothetical protein [Ectothiorhodospira shaposhnikovii]